MRWIMFVAYRYFTSKRSSRGLMPAVLSIIGIAVGCMALISVLGVMNGFQLGFIEDILEIKSYHVRITGEEAHLISGIPQNSDVQKRMRSFATFADVQTLMQGNASGTEMATIRAVDPGVATTDPDLINQLNMVDGNFRLAEPGSMVIGKELARSLSLSIGSTVSLMATSGKEVNLLRPSMSVFKVSGIFSSGYFDFDRHMGFISLDDAALFVGPADLTLGLKLSNQYADRQMVNLLIQQDLAPAQSVESWRSYNRSFFGALRVEKIAMMVLVGLIFIVVGANIHHSLRRSVFERRDEIGVLRSLGATSRAIRMIFVINGLMIGLIGGGIGLWIGMLIMGNVDWVFRVAEVVMNTGLEILSVVFAPLSRTGNMSLFSPEYFYLEEVPSEVPLVEAFFVYAFAVCASAAAAFAASSRVSSIDPAGVLRYE